MKVLLVDSDFNTQNRIKAILEKEFQGIELLDIAQSISELNSKLGQKINYNLIVSEIEFYDGLIFEALADGISNVPIIFMNDTDRFAFRSFDYNCLDYVLKPFQEDRLRKALCKLKNFQEGLSNVIGLVENYLKKPAGKAFKKRFLTKIGNKIKFVATDEISYLYSEDGLSYLIEKGSNQKSIIDHGMNELESELLDPVKFYRINRSCIINSEDLMEMKPYLNSRLVLSMKSKTQHELVVAREKVGDFKKWINQ